MKNIHRKLMIVLGISLLFVVGVLTIIFVILRKTVTQPNVPTPANIRMVSITPIPTTSSRVRVLSTNPETGATNVAVDIADIRILFHSSQKPGQFKIYLGANSSKVAVDTNVTAEGNQLVIKPLMRLTPNSVYTLTIRSAVGNAFIYSLSFTTADVPVVDTFPTGFDSYTEQRDLNERPDIYLANKLPHVSESFQMILEIPDNGPYVYRVKMKIANVEKVRKDVITWLHSINLTDSDIAGFDMRYE